MFNHQASLDLSSWTSGAPSKMTPRMAPPPYTTISLYCGAGGMDRGFAQAGFDIRWAIDNDPLAVKTYNASLEPRAISGDVLRVEPPTNIQPDVVIGGPPCQGFSVIGRMDPEDPRSRHVEHFFDVVDTLRPRAFVMENVKALAQSPRWAPTRARLLDRAERLGYKRALFVLNAAHYAVPQARERMFLVGLREGTPTCPEATTLDEPMTARSALAPLPRFGEPGNDGMCTARVVPAGKPVMRPTAFRGSLLFNGSGRPLLLDAPAKTLPASMGGNATPIVDQHELDFGAVPWVIEYHSHLQRGGKPRRRAPSRLRRITVQEAAALQAFPPTWRFQGPLGAQYRQIGNAVPPPLAQAVAESVRDALFSVDGVAAAMPLAA